MVLRNLVALFLRLFLGLLCGAAGTEAAVPRGEGEPVALVVTSTKAGGPGSLAEAIRQANAAPHGARVAFRIPEADPGCDPRRGVWTITLDAPLLPVTGGRVSIDATTQPRHPADARGSGPAVAIVAARAGVDHALAVVSGDNAVRGIAVGGFRHGIALYGKGAVRNTVAECCIGVRPDGRTARPNETGVLLAAGASRNVLARNVVSGNTSLGVYIGGRETTGNVLRGNRIGSDVSASRRVPNGIGVMIARSSENVVGGSRPGDGNVVSGNDDIGLLLVGKWTEGNALRGNLIGVDGAGTGILHNNIGIVIKSLANGNVVGGTRPAERNVISGNIEIGLYIEAADRNRIVGNIIGPDATGMKAVSDGALVQGNGVEFNTVAKDNVLGGTRPGERNVISGNKVYGVVYYGHCTRNGTAGNFIGTDATGGAPLPNATGICVDCASHHNDIAGNVISGNLSYGLFLVTRGTEHNTLRGNRIGTNAAGTEAVPNDIGMVISTGAARNLVGGEAPGDGNLLSGNRQAALMITNRFTEGNQVVGNTIGTDATATRRLPNGHGVLLSTYPTGNTIRDNVVAGNDSAGVILYEYAEGNAVVGNWIGTNRTRTRALGNRGGGVVVDRHACHNVVGRQGAENCIAHNAHAGMVEGLHAGPGNRLEGNVFQANGGPPIARLRRPAAPAHRPEPPRPHPEEAPGGEPPGQELWPPTQPSPPPLALADARAWLERQPAPRHAATLAVTTTRDSGPGSFRHAIEQCNRVGGRAAIRFDIPTADPGYCPRTGTWTIALRDTPPSLTVSHVLIDGATQSVHRGDTNPNGPEITLDGGGHAIEYGLSLVNASHVTVRGLAVYGFVYGIQIYGPGSHHNRIVGNLIGTDAPGAAEAGNYNGLELLSGAHDNVVGGPTPEERNLVAGNLHIGIRISDASRNVVLGNYVGVDAAARRAVANYDGVCIEGRSRDNVIGGTRPGERNIISGNVAYGVDLFGWDVVGNRVLGNFIGTDLTGTRPVPNTYGVLFDDRASGNIVGGLGKGEGNLISGNTAFGAYFYNNGTRANVLRGNRIGTDATGRRPVPNGTGVHIDGATRDNVVDRNLISGNRVAGVTLFARHTDGNVITGNRIGTDRSGLRPLGNGADGVRMAFGPARNRIGGSPADANIVAYNGRNGVAIESTDATANRISCNRIYGNGHLGIDLFPEGPNRNDPGDADGGPNEGMNSPSIGLVSCEGGTCRISGTLDTAAPERARVEIFIGAVGPSGSVQGRDYLGTARPDQRGRWRLEAAGVQPAAIAATATDRLGNTSEFASWQRAD